MKLTFWTLICAVLLFAVPNAHAADRVHPPSGDDLHAGHSHNHGPLPETSLLPRLSVNLADFCGTDLSSDEAKATMRQIRAQREAGITPLASKNQIIPTIGDRRTFNALAGSVSDGNWSPFEFELVDITSAYYLWVDVADLGEGSTGNVSASDITELRSVMFNQTPARSVNPNQGILANINQTFGQPPNVDGDGIVDILMYDIGAGSGSTLGYVSGSDQLIGASDSIGNERDVLYLDSNEGLRNLTTLSVIAAHEYTHLVHLSYGWDTTFITEGMAEYAMVMNGYYWRGVGYISSISEVSLPLFTWREGGGPGARDYERGGLFFTYIAEQFGHEIVGEMMRDTEKKGSVGLDSVLALRGSSLSDVILDFHTANHLNDTSVDARFGYNEPERSSHNAFLTSPTVNGEIPSTEGEGGFSYQFFEQVEAGSVHYLRFSNVADMDFIYDTPDPTGLFRPSYLLRNRGRVLLQSEDGTTSIQDIRPATDNVRLEGNFSAVTFFLIHDNPNLPRGDFSSIEAFWTPLSLATDAEEADELPQELRITDAWPNPFNAALQLTLALKQAGSVDVDVVDMLGRLVANVHDGPLPAGSHSLRVDASGWPSGTFIVRVVTNDEIVTKSVVHVN